MFQLFHLWMMGVTFGDSSYFDKTPRIFHSSAAFWYNQYCRHLLYVLFYLVFNVTRAVHSNYYALKSLEIISLATNLIHS